MSRLQNFLIKKKNAAEKAVEKSAPVTPQKIANTENKQHLHQSHMQQRSFQEPKQDIIRALSPISQEANNILNKIQLKKSANKQYGAINKLSISAQKQQTKQEQPAPVKVQVFPQLLLMGPFDTSNSDEELKNLEQLMVQCNKTTVIKWIKQKNQGKQCPQDFRNIQMIVDEEFWCINMQKIIEMLIKHQKSFNCCIRMLPRLNRSQSVTLTRTQIYLLISSMFMCIIPYQMNNQLVSFAELMALRPVDERYKLKPPVRLEKLRCVVNYLKYMLKHEQWSDEKVIFQRVFRPNPFYKNTVAKPLSNVVIEEGKIQSGYCKGIIIDFANSNVGGGFLTNGCAQEEILFSIFPEMIVTKLLCETLTHNQAIIAYGARRVNNYEAYSYQFKFNGTYHSSQKDLSKSCIVAIDAIDYKQGVMNKTMQYGQRFIRRELHKIHLGISAAKQKLKDVNEVYTGRWGCGAFAADEILKFCIQWIACSECGLEMRFFTDGEHAVKELRLLVENLRHLNTLELLVIIQAFGKDGGADQKGFLQFLKYYI